MADNMQHTSDHRFTPPQQQLLERIRSIKKQLCGADAEPDLHDAEHYETGLRQHLRIRNALTLSELIKRYLSSKAELSRSTLREYKTYLNKLLRICPERGSDSIAALRPEDCGAMLRNTYPTVSGRNKARKLLHGMFEYARKCGWTEENPFQRLEVQPAEAQSPVVLPLHDIRKLLRLSLTPRFHRLAAALGFMLWEGMRPCEVEKLLWEQVDRRQLSGAMNRWLDGLRDRRERGAVVPKNWHELRRELYRQAGLYPMQSGTLRHTFAAYHLLCFRNPEETARYFRKLSITQLRQRYSNIPGITRNDAETFWFGPLFDDETPALNGPTE